jgi:hypothetical protein
VSAWSRAAKYYAIFNLFTFVGGDHVYQQTHGTGKTFRQQRSNNFWFWVDSFIPFLDATTLSAQWVVYSTIIQTQWVVSISIDALSNC